MIRYLRLCAVALLAMMVVGAKPAIAQLSSADRALFVDAVQKYAEFVTPRCAPEIVLPYINFVSTRDNEFRRSLSGTDLQAVYRAARRENVARESSTVYHCSGPPQPPDGRSARDRAVFEAQQRLQSVVRDLPEYFDSADEAFASMVAARDKLFGRKEP